MNILRAKLIALLVIAILIVVALATWLTSLTLGRPDFSEVVGANAAQIGLFLAQLQGKTADGGSPALGLQREPAGGAQIGDSTFRLRAELARTGLPADAVVTRPPGSPWPVVSLTLPGQAWVLFAPQWCRRRHPAFIWLSSGGWCLSRPERQPYRWRLRTG